MCQQTHGPAEFWKHSKRNTKKAFVDFCEIFYQQIRLWFVGSKSRQSKTRNGREDRSPGSAQIVCSVVCVYHADGMSCKFVNVRFGGRPESDYFSSSHDKWHVPNSPLSLTTLPLCCVVTIDAQSTKTNKRAIFTQNWNFFLRFILKHFTLRAQSKFTRIQIPFDFHCTLLTMQFLSPAAFCLSELHHKPKNSCFPPNHDFKRNRCKANKTRGAQIQF